MAPSDPRPAALSRRTGGGCLFDVRPGTSDERAWTENVRRKQTWRRVAPHARADDCWLDGGAHIGTFAVLVAQAGARVICYEPHPANCVLLAHNLELNGVGGDRVTIREAALIGSGSAGTTPLWVSQSHNTTNHSLYVQRGRLPLPVAVVRIGDALAADPINKIKLDVEGAELGIFWALPETGWPPIREVIFEYHFNLLHDQQQRKYRQLIDLLQSWFVQVDYAAEPRRNWHVLVHAWQNRTQEASAHGAP